MRSGEQLTRNDEGKTFDEWMEEIDRVAAGCRIADMEEFGASGELADGDSEEDAEKIISVCDRAFRQAVADGNTENILQFSGMFGGRYDRDDVGGLTLGELDRFNKEMQRLAHVKRVNAAGEEEDSALRMVLEGASLGIAEAARYQDLVKEKSPTEALTEILVDDLMADIKDGTKQVLGSEEFALLNQVLSPEEVLSSPEVRRVYAIEFATAVSAFSKRKSRTVFLPNDEYLLSPTMRMVVEQENADGALVSPEEIQVFGEYVTARYETDAMPERWGSSDEDVLTPKQKEERVAQLEWLRDQGYSAERPKSAKFLHDYAMAAQPHMDDGYRRIEYVKAHFDEFQTEALTLYQNCFPEDGEVGEEVTEQQKAVLAAYLGIWEGQWENYSETEGLRALLMSPPSDKMARERYVYQTLQPTAIMEAVEVMRELGLTTQTDWAKQQIAEKVLSRYPVGAGEKLIEINEWSREGMVEELAEKYPESIEIMMDVMPASFRSDGSLRDQLKIISRYDLILRGQEDAREIFDSLVFGTTVDLGQVRRAAEIVRQMEAPSAPLDMADWDEYAEAMGRAFTAMPSEKALAAWLMGQKPEQDEENLAKFRRITGMVERDAEQWDRKITKEQYAELIEQLPGYGEVAFGEVFQKSPEGFTEKEKEILTTFWALGGDAVKWSAGAETYRAVLMAQGDGEGMAYEKMSLEEVQQLSEVVQTLFQKSSAYLQERATQVTERVLGLGEEEALAQIALYDEAMVTLFESNSAKLVRLADALSSQLLKSDGETALEQARVLEQAMLQKNVPDFAKLYCCASILYEDAIGENEDISPVLKSAENRREVLLTDLLKNAIRSNNRSLRVYLEHMVQGAEMEASGDMESSGVLDEFRDGKKFRTKMLGYARNLGFESLEELLSAMDGYRDERDRLHRVSVVKQEGHYRLREGIHVGDMIKGINMQYLDSMMQDGFNCPEMVGEAARQDATLWDTDMGSAREVTPDARGAGIWRRDDGLKSAVETSLAAGYGIGYYVVMRDDARFEHTSPDNVGAYDSLKQYEAYHGKVNGENFRGIRTGFGSEDVDFYVVGDEEQRYLGRLKYEIAKNGCYVPIVDLETEEVIFTPEEFDGMRRAMGGLRRYGEDLGSYAFAEELTLPGAEFQELVDGYEDKESTTYAIQTMLTAYLVVAIERSDLPTEVKQAFRSYNRFVSEDAMPGVVDALSTGSTGRFTNEPHDADFDFVWRIDKTILKQYQTAIIAALTKGVDGEPPLIERFGEHGGVIDKGIRKGMLDIALGDQIVTVEVDISPVTKTDKLEFSSEQALGQRLASIKEQDEEKYQQVIANIVMAKRALKEGGVYKKVPDQGLGGIGTETWVLQHGGSLLAAAKAFLAAAKDEEGSVRTLSEFRKLYTVFDLGENHFSQGYPYDDFIDNLTDDGKAGVGSYRKMIGVCEKIVMQSEQGK